jgi:hypothetical protein
LRDGWRGVRPRVPGATSVVATRTPVASQTHGEA